MVFFISSKAAGDGAAALILTNIKAPKNGYAYVYLSNESAEPVYFDNMQVTHERKQIIEENHYYSYGLKIAAISSRKLGDGSEGQLRNQYLYNDKELWEDADLNWYDYGFRNYDAQIRRFPQLDPLTFDYPYYTPYQYSGCEPIANVDVDGLEPFSSISSASQLGLTLNNLGLSVGKLAVSKTLETVVMTSGKIAKAGSSLSTVVSITSLLRNGMQQVSEDNGIKRNLQATENLHKHGRHNDWNDWWHPKGSASDEVKGGVSWNMEGGQGEPPHVKEEYRNINNQQGENLDGFTFTGGGGTTTDHGANNSGSVEIGSIFDIANMFRGEAVASFAPYKPSANVSRVITYVEWHSTIGESTYKASEELKALDKAKQEKQVAPLKYDPNKLMYPETTPGRWDSDSGKTKPQWRNLQKTNPNIKEPKPITLKQIL